MKNIIFYILGFITLQVATQNDCDANIIANFECDSNQTLPATVSSVSNTFSGGINTSANIGEYTDNGTEGFDALIIDYGTAIDLSVNNQLKIKLYSPTRSIQILAKLEGGTAQEIFSPFSETGEWQEFIFDFSNSDGANNTRLVLFFDVDVTTGANPELYYFDDLEWTSMAALNVEDTTLTGVNVFNTNNTLKIYGLENQKGTLNIYNILGAEVLKQEMIFNNQSEINIDNFNTGIYIIKINTEKGYFQKKIIIR